MYIKLFLGGVTWKILLYLTFEWVWEDGLNLSGGAKGEREYQTEISAQICDWSEAGRHKYLMDWTEK